MIVVRIAAVALCIAPAFGVQTVEYSEPRPDLAFASRYENYCDTFECWESAGITSPTDLLARAAGGEVASICDVLRLSTTAPLDGAGSEGHRDILFGLLNNVGDRQFAFALSEMSMEERRHVNWMLSDDLAESGCSVWASEDCPRRYPRTWIAMGGGRQDGSDSPDIKSLMPYDSLPTNVVDGSEFWAAQFQVDENESLPATIEVNSKGNGVLSISNLLVRVYDDHDDGSMFRPALAAVERRVIRGKPALIVRATRIYTTSETSALGTHETVDVVATYEDGHFVVQRDRGGLVLQQ